MTILPLTLRPEDSCRMRKHSDIECKKLKTHRQDETNLKKFMVKGLRYSIQFHLKISLKKIYIYDSLKQA